MSDILKYENSEVEDKIILVRNQHVIIDSDVAELYGVETKRINEAVKNNPEKFPAGYILDLSNDEWNSLRSKISTLKSGRGEHTKYIPKAFTEKGLYMLATILKSAKATQTTILIVETYAKIRELSRTIKELSETKEEFQQKSLMEKGGDIISEILGQDLMTTDTETSIELNFAVLKLKHTVKRKEGKDKKQ
ncbi:MAG: ORF6N domain-containing protein [Bacteroidia bacterium]|nr:ORF6N domain-containing protein [Bacteroidia bacterium]